MIYYTFYEEDPKRKTELVKQPIKYLELDEEVEKWWLSVAGAGLGASLGAIYYLKNVGAGAMETITSRAFPFFIVMPEEIKKLMMPYRFVDDCELKA